jgi:hypothetical protein
MHLNIVNSHFFYTYIKDYFEMTIIKEFILLK